MKERHFEQKRAERTTRWLLSDSSVPALYEPAFTFGGVHTRVDILRRSHSGEFDLIEVKSTTGLKDVHIPDVAIQVHVVEGCGVPIRRAYLMHIDNGYVYQGGDHDLEGLFALEDVTDSARSYIETAVSDYLSQMWKSIKSTESLEIKVGQHCTTPYRCPFFGHCHADEPEHPIRELPNLGQSLRERLMAEDISDIRDIPPGYSGLSATQRRVMNSVAMGKSYVGKELRDRLARIRFPACFLDFETFSPAIPVHPGTRPYQTIPFQWSLHVRSANGELVHRSFLDDAHGDPRERFITSLLAAVPPRGTVVTYSSYESTGFRFLGGDDQIE